MATLKSTIKIDSSDFFSTKLDVSTSNTTLTTGDDRAFSVERVPVGVNAYTTITQTATALAGMDNKTIIFTDNQQNSHTITFSDEYSNESSGNKATGTLNVNGGTVAAYNGLTLILVDNHSGGARTVTITFNHTTTTLVRQAGATSTAIAYALGLSGLATPTAIRDKIVTDLTAIRTAGDLSIIAVASATNVELINLTQDVVGNGGNTSITGTSGGGQITLTSFTTGGDPYTSSYAGISNNAATTTAHLISLRNSLSKAINEGKLNMRVGEVPTASTLLVYMDGPYVNDNTLTLSGTAITTASTTAATAFSGAGIPDILPCGEFNSLYNKVYLYAANKSNSGIVNIYHKESVARGAGSVIMSKADTTDINDGGAGVLTLSSAAGYDYTFTIVAEGAIDVGVKVSDLVYQVEMNAASDVFIQNLIETFMLVDNKAGREARPFEATAAENGLSINIRQTDSDAGTTGNTTITQNWTGGTLTVTDTDFTGGLDRYHLICRLDPGEHIYAPLSGFSKLYVDANVAITDLEYLTIEK
jgi:hypothetical protein